MCIKTFIQQMDYTRLNENQNENSPTQCFILCAIIWERFLLLQGCVRCCCNYAFLLTHTENVGFTSIIQHYSVLTGNILIINPFRITNINRV